MQQRFLKMSVQSTKNDQITIHYEMKISVSNNNSYIIYIYS